MTTQGSSGDYLTWNREEKIAVPGDASERRYAIRYSDWSRVKRNVAQLTNRPKNLPIWYGVLFGVAGSAGLSVVPVAAAQGLPTWVTPFYFPVFLFSLITGGVLVWLERTMTVQYGAQAESIQEEMADIEAMFASPD